MSLNDTTVYLLELLMYWKLRQTIQMNVQNAYTAEKFPLLFPKLHRSKGLKNKDKFFFQNEEPSTKARKIPNKGINEQPYQSH